MLRTVLLVALLHSSPLAPPLSLSALWGQDHHEASYIPGASPASTLSEKSQTSAATTTRTTSSRAMFVSGQGTTDDQPMDQDDSMLQDPSLVNPQNKQGYGKDDPDQIFHSHKAATSGKKSEKADKKKAAEDAKPRSMGDQTMQAALQMGVLVSVFLLFALLFFVNVAIELVIDQITNMLSELLGRSKEIDIEDQDPASLVGTFKRYK